MSTHSIIPSTGNTIVTAEEMKKNSFPIGYTGRKEKKMIKKRMNAGYEIVRSKMYDQEIHIDGAIAMTAEIVLGHDTTEKKVAPWVVWHCFNGTDYTWGHYFCDGDNALMYWHNSLALEYKCLEESHQNKALTVLSKLQREIK